MFPAWWRHLFTLACGKGKLAHPRRARISKPLASRRPAIEQLEDRLVPTTVSVPVYSLNAVGPTDGQGQQGGFVYVPITVDTLQDNGQGLNQIGLGNSSFVFYYNPKVFKPLTQANVTVGSLPDDPTFKSPGWAGNLVSVSGTPAGYGNVTLTTSGANLTSTGGGNLVILNFQVLANAPLGTAYIDLAADTGGNLTPPITSLGDGSDSGGMPFTPYTLAPNPNSNDPQGIPPGNGPTDNTGDVQTLAFSGSINGGTFELGFETATTTPISYSTTVTLLQSNIQSALDALSSIGPVNTLVTANSATNVSVTFQGTLGGGVTQPLMSVTSQLTGANALVLISDSGFGYYGLSNDSTFNDPTDGSVNITVPAVQDHFVLTAPSSIGAGTAFTFTVTAENTSNAIDSGYNGTVQFTSSDPLVSVGSGLPNNGASAMAVASSPLHSKRRAAKS